MPEKTNEKTDEDVADDVVGPDGLTEAERKLSPEQRADVINEMKQAHVQNIQQDQSNAASKRGKVETVRPSQSNPPPKEMPTKDTPTP